RSPPDFFPACDYEYAKCPPPHAPPEFPPSGFHSQSKKNPSGTPASVSIGTPPLPAAHRGCVPRSKFPPPCPPAPECGRWTGLPGSPRRGGDDDGECGSPVKFLLISFDRFHGRPLLFNNGEFLLFNLCAVHLKL